MWCECATPHHAHHMFVRLRQRPGANEQTCSVELLLPYRYTVRHNAVLSLLIAWLRSNISCQQRLYANLVEVNVLPAGNLFQGYRPDIAVACANFIYVLKLTVCHETNKYKNIGAMGLLWQAIEKLFPISLKFLLWVSLLIYGILLRF